MQLCRHNVLLSGCPCCFAEPFLPPGPLDTLDGTIGNFAVVNPQQQETLSIWRAASAFTAAGPTNQVDYAIFGDTRAEAPVPLLPPWDDCSTLLQCLPDPHRSYDEDIIMADPADVEEQYKAAETYDPTLAASVQPR